MCTICKKNLWCFVFQISFALLLFLAVSQCFCVIPQSLQAFSGEFLDDGNLLLCMFKKIVFQFSIRRRRRSWSGRITTIIGNAEYISSSLLIRQKCCFHNFVLSSLPLFQSNQKPKLSEKRNNATKFSNHYYTTHINNIQFDSILLFLIQLFDMALVLSWIFLAI